MTIGLKSNVGLIRKDAQIKIFNGYVYNAFCKE